MNQIKTQLKNISISLALSSVSVQFSHLVCVRTCVQTLPALQPLGPEGSSLLLHPGGPVSGRVRGAGRLPSAHLGLFC